MGFIKNKGSKLFQLAQLLPQMAKSVKTSNARNQKSRMCSASASGIGLLRLRAVLYWTSKSQDSASALLPLTSLTKIMIAAR